MARAQSATLKRSNSKSRSSDTPPLEWLLAILGILMLGAGVSFLLYEGLTRRDTPGAVHASVVEIHEAGDSYIVTFAASNTGGENLSQLYLTARLLNGAEVIESAQAIVDYLPAGGTQRGGFYLRHDPRRYTLEIHPAGYITP